VIANTTRGVRPVKPHLRVIEAKPEKRLFDGPTRDFCIRRIRFLSRAYRLQWLIDQHQFNAPCLESLSDRELSALVRALEHARECIAENLPLEDAGLIQDTSARVESMIEDHDQWQ
jgi:hypothetical protein